MSNHAHVDLNPIRAGIAKTPEKSDHTSIKERIRGASTSDHPVEPETAATGKRESGKTDCPPAPLMPFDATGRTPWAIPFDFRDYLELVDWTGRAIRPEKRGFIPEKTPEILGRLGIDARPFIEYSGRMLKVFGTAVGAPEQMVALCAKRQARFLWGLRASRRLFPRALAA